MNFLETNIMKRIATLILLALIIPQIAFAWGRLGHRTVAEIAERNLTPKAKANIEKFTNGTPLWKYSLWLDEIRDEEPYKTATYGWHASIVDSDCTSPQIIRDRYRQGQDAVTASYQMTEILKDYRNQTDSAVMVALKSLIHTVADFHCPGHVRYVDFENKGRFAVNFYGKMTDMHKVWDTACITKFRPKHNQFQYADLLNTLDKKQIKALTKGDYQQWFEDAARDVQPALYWVYDTHRIEKLDDKFLQKGGPLCEQLMQKAGYRLAAALNAIFK